MRFSPQARGSAVPLAVALFASLCSAVAAAAQSNGTRAQTPQRPARSAKAPAALPCGDIVGFQVLLDRRGFSTGEIDGQAGHNFSRALSAFQESKQAAANGQPDCDAWRALGGNGAPPLVADYVVTDADLKGPFFPDLPANLEQQAALPALGYRTPLEEIAERFHSAPALLQRLNQTMKVSAGQTIKVPGVDPFDPETKPAPAGEAGLTIEVSRDESTMRARRADSTLAFYAPVTTGSEHDPLPAGNWKVTGVSWQPGFHYNPDLFWDAKPDARGAMLKPGPNSPVGVVWIDVNIPHYGLHGTPEPGRIGATESHGCVRLTNWDAAKLSSLVSVGSPVIFK